LLFLSAALLLTSSALVIACLGPHTKPGYLLGLYVAAYAQIVCIQELAGLLSALVPAVVLVFQGLVSAVSAIAWVRKGRPPILAAFHGFRPNEVFWKQGFRSALAHGLISLLAISTGLLMSWSALLILALPPDNFDSLVYHLSRVGYWMQYKSFYPWPTPTLHQTTFPMNAEMGVLWTVLWWGTDQLAGFVQWTALLAVMLGIYGLARLLGCSRPQSAFPALLFPTLTQVLYQSSTTQNDIVTSSFWGALVYFLFAGLRQRRSAHLYLSAAAFGLAIGTKSTSLMILPGFLLAVFLGLLLHHTERGVKMLMIRWAVVCLGGFALLGSYTYLQNMAAFGHPLGPRTFYAGILSSTQEGVVGRHTSFLRDNAARYVYQLVDFSPLPLPLPQKINTVKAAVFSAAFDLLGISVQNPETIRRYSFDLGYINPLNEGGAWFGPLMLFVIPAVLVQGVEGLRRRDALRLALAVIPMSFLAIHSAAQPWTDAKGRYYMIAVALAMPTVAPLLGSSALWVRGLRLLVAGTALSVAMTVLSSIESAYTVSFQNMWFRSGVPRFDNNFSGQMIKENVPLNASIAVSSYPGFMDYPLFGESFTRKVTLGLPDGMEASLPRGDLNRYERDFRSSDFLFLPRGGSTEARALAEREFALLSQSGSEALWMRRTLRPAAACDDSRWPFSTWVEVNSDLVCPRFPIRVGPGLLIEHGGFEPVLEPGPTQEVSFDLLVRLDSEITISIELDPGNFKRKQDLELAVESSGGTRQEFRLPFREPGSVQQTVQLAAGTHTVRVVLLEGSRAVKILRIGLGST
jgi:hypothetical protein